MMPMLPPPASPLPLTRSPSPLAGEGRGGGSALGIVKKLRVRNPHHLTAAGSAARQRGTVLLQFRPHLLVIIPEPVLVPRGGIDDMDQHSGSVHVAEEFQPQPGPGMGALDQPGKVRHDERRILRQLDDAQHRLQGGEGIIANLGPGGAGGRQERRLTGIGKADEAGIRDQLQLQPQPARLPRLTQLGEAWRLPGRGLEAGITPTAPSPASDHQPLIRTNQVRDRLALLILDERARWDLQDEVGGVFPVAPATAATPTPARGEVMLEAVILERLELPGNLEDYMAAAAAVAAVGAAARHVLLAPEAQCAR